MITLPRTLIAYDKSALSLLSIGLIVGQCLSSILMKLELGSIKVTFTQLPVYQTST